MIDRLLAEDKIEVSFDINKSIIEYTEMKKNLKRFDIYCVLSLFEENGYSFDGMLRYLFSLIDIDSINNIENKRDIFNNENELKHSKDKQLINLFKIVYKQLAEDKVVMPKNFNRNLYINRLDERISKADDDIDNIECYNTTIDLTPFSNLLSIKDLEND